MRTKHNMGQWRQPDNYTCNGKIIKMACFTDSNLFFAVAQNILTSRWTLEAYSNRQHLETGRLQPRIR